MKITGFFSNIKSANETVEKLKQAGFDSAFVDINDHYIDERNIQTNLPGTETSPSLSGLVLNSSTHAVDKSKTPLTAADPTVSGMAGFEHIAGARSRVVVDVNEPQASEAEKIIKSMGGSLDNPNTPHPKPRFDEDMIFYSAVEEIHKDH